MQINILMEMKGESLNNKPITKDDLKFEVNEEFAKNKELNDENLNLLIGSSNSNSNEMSKKQKLSSDAEKPSSGSKDSNDDTNEKQYFKESFKAKDKKNKEYTKRISKISEASKLNKSDDSMLVAWFANKLKEDNEQIIKDNKYIYLTIIKYINYKIILYLWLNFSIC